MKKLLPILIGLSLTGFSAMSQAENPLQVYQQARISNPDLRKSAADRDAAFEKINEARSPLLPQLGVGSGFIPIPMAIATATASTLTSPAVRCS
ncbi:outer membrane channel protein [Klebsiella pneumoniae subsp. rhinoscleromatis]|nr:outer membrane channel protein [Klebsiella pneumoniae subsp. rhinoscleromatis]